MATFPCAKKGLCLDPSTPFSNLSAELPDSEIFVSLNWGQELVAPPLGSDFTATSCLGVATSTVSQEDADLDAAQANADCIGGIFPEGSPGTNIYGQPVTVKRPQTVYRNQPQSVTLICPDGLPFIYTINAGRFSGASLYAANASAFSWAEQQAPNFQICLSNLNNPVVCAGQPYSDFITATGKPLAVAPKGNFWSYIAGNLPPGIYSDVDLSFEAGLDGFIVGSGINFYGSCSVPGVYTVTIEVTAPDGEYFAKRYTITVPGINNAADFAPGIVGKTYSQEVTSAGVANPIYTLESGTLPAGLTLAPQGLIAGAPTVAGTYNFTLGVTSAGTGRTCTTFGCTITVTGPNIFLPTVWDNPPDAANGTVVYNFSHASVVGSAACDAPDNVSNVANTGTLPYTGAGAVCNVKITVSNLVNSIPGETDCQVSIFVFSAQNGLLLFDILDANAATLFDGVFNFPFNIPAAAGDTITLLPRWSATASNAGPASLNVDFEFTGN